MTTIKHPLMPGVQQSSHWPWEYGSFPFISEGDRRTGPWRLGMDGSGSLVLWPMSEPLLEGLIEVIRGEKEELVKAFVFTRLGYETDPNYIYQDGAVHIFNWRSFTLAQVDAACHIIGLLLDGKREQAQAAGRLFQEQIDAACVR